MAEALYEGKAKIVYPTEDRQVLRMVFKDDATAGNGAKRATIPGKGSLNAQITCRLLRLVEAFGVSTHLIEKAGERTLLVRRLEMIPLEVVLRNVVAGSFARRLGRSEGDELPWPVVEFYLKDDALGDPLLNDDHVAVLGYANPEEVMAMKASARRVNQALGTFLWERGIRLVDFKLEFGRADGTLLLGDEISPDTCRLWDAKTGEKLDKDRFRRDLGGVAEAYSEVLGRLKG